VSDYWQLFVEAQVGYARWLAASIVDLSWSSAFWWLLGLSSLVWLLEITLPWRSNQRVLRRGVWLDAWYVCFNGIVFPLLGFIGAVKVFGVAFGDLLHALGRENLVALEVGSWPGWTQILLLFVLRDFAHWNIHRLLHRVPRLWEFHKVHHSALEMGFTAHLRFHWVETVVYRTLEALPLALIGFSVTDFALAHLVALLIGHLNHANLGWTYGPLRFVFNNPAMHIWHHAKRYPADRPFGANFGISLSLWDWLFGAAWWPESGRDLPLGFEQVESFPRGFFRQLAYPWSRASRATRRSSPGD